MNYYAVVFLLRPPDLLRHEPLFEGTNVCNSQEDCVCTPCAAIVNHYAIVDLLRRANLLRRSIFSTAGSFGQEIVTKGSAKIATYNLVTKTKSPCGNGKLLKLNADSVLVGRYHSRKSVRTEINSGKRKQKAESGNGEPNPEFLILVKGKEPCTGKRKP